MQQGILQLLFYSDLIKRQGHVVSLQHADFSGASLENISLINSCFESVHFDGANLALARLDESNLRQSSLKGANLKGTKLIRVNLSGKSNLEEVSGINTKFMKSDLREVKFNNADLRKANFQGANLRGANFDGADLRGANLRQIEIDNKTSFKGAKYNSKSLDNKVSVSQKEAFSQLLQALKLDKAFDIRGLSDTELKLDPTQYDEEFFPKDKGMRLDHRM
jgi:uncharacterized protein YjbI with pentapeptide repeats